jgi:diguanylate cyclase (GGDEF)-like protein
MDTIEIAVPTIVGLEVVGALSLSWLWSRLARQRQVRALRDLSWAFLALAFAAVNQLIDLHGHPPLRAAALDLGRSLAVWLYLGFLVLGAAQLASEDFVTHKVRRDTVLGAVLAALLTAAISLTTQQNVVAQDMIRHALLAGGTGVACAIIARIVARTPAPATMAIGASVVRVALTLVAVCSTVQAVTALAWLSGQLAGTVQWEPLIVAEFLAHCALCVGLVIWILDRDWAIAHASANAAEQRASTDPLTGLPNRSLVLDRLDVALAGAKRNGTYVGVLFVDLDDFKQVNDQYGHLVGDVVLRSVADRLHQLLRASDTVGRMGGDEFVAVSPFLRTPADLEVVTAKVRLSLAHVVVHDGVSINVSGSVGSALFPRDGDNTTALLAQADAALYADKRARRQTVPTPAQLMTA